MMRRRHLKRCRYYQENRFALDGVLNAAERGCEEDVGRCVRTLREERGLSLRALADQSGISVNTLSLIENGKTSPSVSTLQKISGALRVPLVALFLPSQDDRKVVYTRCGLRKKATFEHVALEDLSAGLSEGVMEPFTVTLEPHASSGPDSIIHSGYEFVYCLSGRIAYIIDNQRYILEPGDSLFFESHLPHCWQNLSAQASKKILVLCSTDELDHPFERHFSPEL